MEKKSINMTLKKLSEHRLLTQMLPIIFMGVLILFFAVATKGRFVEITSLKIIFEQALIVGTVATGASFIFASNNVNIAMGATTVLVATISGMLYNRTGSVAAMVAFAIVFGMTLMAGSALLSTVLNIRVIYVTIVMMNLFAAIQQSLLGGTTISLPYEMITMLSDNGFAYIIFILYFVVSMVLFHGTNIGRALRMIGTNDQCAEQTGLQKGKYLFIAFLIAGVGCGIAALLAIVRAGSVGPKTLSTLNMDCMFALVLGGMSVFGGSKSFAYAGIIGALTVGILNQGMLMINVDSTIIQALRGILFLILVYTAQQRPQGLPAPEG